MPALRTAVQTAQTARATDPTVKAALDAYNAAKASVNTNAAVVAA